MATPVPDALKRYRAKRSASSTPEPFGAVHGESMGRFVVQKHAARRLHYDFRLELAGVLKSWAVPRGPSADPAEKRLAVEVEDHPVEYADFEGRIPPGNYGAGAVIVWDRGSWAPAGDPMAGLAAGKLVFRLDGYKLRGEWTLVRTRRAPAEWLLMKHRDAFADPGARHPPGEASVLSGLLVEDLARGAGSADLEAEAVRLGAARRRVDPREVRPMLASARSAAFTAPGWIFELKYDGYRALASREDGQVAVRYRSGREATPLWPEIARALASLPAERLVLDGEIVVLDAEGRPSFQGLQGRAQLSRARDAERAAVERPATLLAFDLLALGDLDLRPLPLRDRKALLARLAPRQGPIRYADHVEERGEDLWREVLARRLEGIVGKRMDAPYRAGRSPAWVKVRAERTGDFAIVGYTAPGGKGRQGFGALHLAVHDGRRLVYAGSVGTGFDGRALRDIRARLEPLRRKAPALSGAFPTSAATTWVEPALCCEVRFLEWTAEGLLRHPAFLRLREDKRPEECAREGWEAEPEEAGPVLVEGPPADEPTLSNLDKPYFPEDGITKRDLLDYYRAVAPWLLPYLRDRPLVLTRFPDGIHGKSFFQKDAPDWRPPWMRTVRVWSGDTQREIDHFVCDDLRSLLYVVNLGSIPLHVWSSRIPELGRPDWCVVDLDPKEAPFQHVVTLARALRALCEEIGLPSFAKTTGQAGLHVLVPLGRQCTHEQSRALAGLLARAVAARHPDIATLARSLPARGGRVYLDTLQNGHGKTIAAPLCVRPRAGAPVSTPLRWSEVGARLEPARFTIRTVPARLRRLRGDPLLPVLSLKPDLVAALGRLRAHFPEEA